MWMDDYGVKVEDNPEIIPVLSEKSNDANTSKNNMLWGLSHFSKNIFFFSFYAQTKFKSVLMKRPADTLVIKAWFKFSIFPLGLEIIYIYMRFLFSESNPISANFSVLIIPTPYDYIELPLTCKKNIESFQVGNIKPRTRK